MRCVLLFAVLSLIAPAALADPQPLGALIAAISGDWNGDDLLDAATLTRAEDGMADLTLYRNNGTHGLEPVLVLEGQVFAGPMAGQAPGFAPVSDTSFAILTEQTGVGRTPWYQRITVAYREGQFVVAGFTYDYYDRLHMGRFGSCDVNLLTGDYQISVSTGDREEDRRFVEDSAVTETRSGRVEPSAFPLGAYTNEYWPEICSDLF